MRPTPSPPTIGISCCLKPVPAGFAHAVNANYVDAVADGAGGVPLLVPALADRLAIDALLDRIDGLMLTGSPSNVDPVIYGGPQPRAGNASDALRDGTTLPLIRAAVTRRVPLLAVCRGIQELNVALGGTLHQFVHELPGRRDHRSNKTLPRVERYAAVHPIDLTPGGVLQEIQGGVGRIEVNSLHAQGIDRLAPGLVVEAVAPDGTIEAVSHADRRIFCLGVQWHPEWRVRSHPTNLALFEAFAAACRLFAQQKAAHGRLGSVA